VQEKETVIYHSETQKIRPLVARYVLGDVLDIGCGTHKISIDAIGVDIRKTSAVERVVNSFDCLREVKGIGDIKWDTVFSSHCLEHLKDDWQAIEDWCNLLKKNGHLILYLPDDAHYDNDKNPEHLHRYKYEEFLKEFKARCPFMEVVCSGPHVGYDLYSFYLVAKNTCAID
jgi:SAM-dependent methyltransferase